MIGVQLILRGQSFDITVDEILKVTQAIPPDPLVRYAVQLHDRWYPPKQVLSLATGLPVAAFTTQDAYRAMQRLGLVVVEASSLKLEGDD